MAPSRVIRKAHADLREPLFAADAARFYLDDLGVVCQMLGVATPPPATVRRRVIKKLSAMVELRKPAPKVRERIETVLAARGLRLRPPRPDRSRADLVRALRLHQGRHPSVPLSDR